MAGNCREMSLNGVETFRGARGGLFSCKNYRNRLSGRVDIGKFGDFFQNLTAERWFWGSPGPKNRN